MVVPTSFAVELVGVGAVPEGDRPQCWFVAVSADYFFLCWAPVEPAEVVLFLAFCALESCVPGTSEHVVFEGVDALPDWVALLLFCRFDFLAVVAGLGISGFVETHDGREGFELISVFSFCFRSRETPELTNQFYSLD